MATSVVSQGIGDDQGIDWRDRKEAATGLSADDTDLSRCIKRNEPPREKWKKVMPRRLSTACIKGGGS